MHLRNFYWSHWSWYSEGFFPPYILRLTCSCWRWAKVYGLDMNPSNIHMLKTWSPVLAVFRGEVLRKGMDPRNVAFVSGLTHWLGCCEKGDSWTMRPIWGSRPQEAYSILKGLYPPCVLFFSLFVSAVRFPLCHFSLTILLARDAWS